MANKAIFDVNSAFTSDSTLSTALNSLTTGSTATGAAQTNGTSLALLMDVSLNLGSFNPSGTPFFEIHMVPLSGDGSTYADTGAATLVDTVQCTTGSSAKVAVAVGIPILPGSFKVAIINQTGATLASSSNTAYIRLYDYNLNG